MELKDKQLVPIPDDKGVHIKSAGAKGENCVLANAKDIGMEHVHMFMDGGFWSGECIQSLARECDAFILGMPAYLTDAEQAVGHCREDSGVL